MTNVPATRGFKAAVIAALALSAAACLTTRRATAQTPTTPIQHVIIIMQENRSFDSYFGTFPGADGIPANVCQPISLANPSAGCVAPFHDVHDSSLGGPHAEADAQHDLDDGVTTEKQDGFVDSQTQQVAAICASSPKSFICTDQTAKNTHDVAGYHTDAEIPNYWAYAKNFVLQDRLFEGVRSWSGPAHEDLASEWWATCSNVKVASTCKSGNVYNNPGNVYGSTGKPFFPWANLYQLLDKYNVTWKSYLGEGSEPDCDDSALTCNPTPQLATVPSFWNVAPSFAYVQAKGKAYLVAHNPNTNQFLLDLRGGTLPQVSWIVPGLNNSEHPGNSGVTAGEMYVTALVNAVMQSPYWNSTAIFISWDDWGGFYDHVVPPNVDMNTSAYPVQGFGLRVPGLMISAYARRGYIDHQMLSFENYAAFFENLFMGGARLDPKALGNPDARPTIRDSLTSVTFPDGHVEPVGDLMNEFDFTQPPRAPLVLNTHIPVNIHKYCRKGQYDYGVVCQIPKVTVQWDALADGTYTYNVLRDGIALPACSGSATSCVDTPGSGAHFYQVYSVDANGTSSLRSPMAEADEP